MVKPAFFIVKSPVFWNNTPKTTHFDDEKTMKTALLWGDELLRRRGHISSLAQAGAHVDDSTREPLPKKVAEFYGLW